MPKSTRCGECNTPIKGHSHRDTGKAIRVVQKIRKNGPKRPEKTFSQQMEAALVNTLRDLISEENEVKPSGSTHKAIVSNPGWQHKQSDKHGSVKIHRYEHPVHGHLTTIHGEGKPEWFYNPHGKQTTHSGPVSGVSDFLGALQKRHDRSKQ